MPERRFWFFSCLLYTSPGASEGKENGLVYVAVKFKGDCRVAENHFKGSRETVQQRSALCAFQMVYEFLNKR